MSFTIKSDFILLFVCINLVICEEYSSDADEKLEGYVAVGDFLDLLGKTMSETLDPCDDFYEFVCSNKSYDTFQEIRYQEGFKLQHLFEVKNKTYEPETQSEKKARILYESCMNLPHEGLNGVGTQRQVLRTIGNFPFLNANWSAENFDYLEIVANLSAFGIETFISTKLVSRPSSPSRYAFQIGPGPMVDMTRDDEAKNSIVELITRNKLQIHTLNESLISQIINLHKEFAQYDFLTEHSLYHQKQVMTYRELKLKILKVNWSKYFTIVYGTEPEDNDHIILMDGSYFDYMFNIISKTNPEILANFFMSKFIEKYAYIVSEESAECRMHVVELMPDVVSAMLIQENYNDFKDVSNIFSRIKSSFLAIIRQSDWLNDRTRKYLVRHLMAVRLVMGNNVNASQTFVLDPKYEGLQFNRINFFKNIQNYWHYMHRKTLQSAKERKFGYLLQPFNPLEVNPFYLKIENKLAVPNSAMNRIIYHPGFPMCLKFGGLGYLIANAISYATNPEYQPKNHLWTNMSLTNYHNGRNCLINFYNKFQLSSPIESIGRITVDSNFADNLGLQISLMAYKKWLEMNLDDREKLHEETLHRFQLNEIQSFFIALVKAHCRNGSMQYETYLKSRNVLPDRFRILGILKNSQEFADAFNCPTGSGMNPAEKCQIFQKHSTTNTF